MTATAIGIPLSIALARRLLPGGGVLLATVMLPLVVPSIVFAVAFLVILVRILDVGLRSGRSPSPMSCSACRFPSWC